MMKRFVLSLLVALGIATSSMAANQAPMQTPTSGPHSAADFTLNYLNPALLAIATCSWGTAPPANGPGLAATQFQCWADTSASPTVVLKIFDGTSWLTTFTVNISTHQMVSTPADLVVRSGAYGAKCDSVTDDTTSIQNAWNAAGAKGVDVYVGDVGTAGKCIVSGTLVQPTPTGEGRASFIVGPGSSLIRLVSTVGGTGCTISLSPTYGVNSYLRGSFQGFALERTALDQQGYGICLNGVTQATFRDVMVRGFARGFSGVDTTSIDLIDLTLFYNSVGIYGEIGSISPPNGWTVARSKFLGNHRSAIRLLGPNLLNVSQSEFQSNSYDPAFADRATIQIIGPPGAPVVGANVTYSYFEGNQGSTDFQIDQNGASGAAASGTYNFKHNTVIRTLANQTSGVNIINSGTLGATTTVNVDGNGFYDNLANPSGFSWLSAQTPATANYRFNCSGNQSEAYLSVEMPALCRVPAAYSVPYVDAAGQFSGFGALPFAALPAMTTATLLGNPGATTLAPQEISLGGTFVLVGTELRNVPLSGDFSSPPNSFNGTLNTVNASPGSFGSATSCVSITTNGKGLTTAISAATCTPDLASLTGFGTGTKTALGNGVNTAGGVVTVTGANQVSRAMEAQGVARSVMGVAGNATANVADIQGTANQFFGVNAAGTALGFQTMSGDGTLSGGAITITKTNGVAFAPSATTDTTSQSNVAFTGLTAAAAVADADTFPTNQGASNLKQAFAAVKTWIKSWIAKADVGLGNVPNVDATNATNISSGTLPVGRMPALTGGACTTSSGAVSTTCIINTPITISGSNVTSITAGATVYYGAGITAGTNTVAAFPVMLAGTIKGFNCYLSTAPGAGQTSVCTLQKGTGGAAPSDTTITCSIVATATTCGTPDTTHTVTIAVGDTLVMKIVAGAGAASAVNAAGQLVLASTSP